MTTKSNSNPEPRVNAFYRNNAPSSRIELGVLSVVAQQIHTIQHAVAHNIKQFMFEGVELTLNNSCSIFITMNTSVGASDREVRYVRCWFSPPP